MKAVALGTIKLYRLMLSPYLGGACRHYPSCSVYAQEAISKYGALRGTRLAIGRLTRCRPFGTFGYDPVP
jgi:putative membrane protein insertion efficiency factor